MSDEMLLRRFAAVAGLDVRTRKDDSDEVTLMACLPGTDDWVIATNGCGILVDFDIKTADGQVPNNDDDELVHLSSEQMEAITGMMEKMVAMKLTMKPWDGYHHISMTIAEAQAAYDKERTDKEAAKFALTFAHMARARGCPGLRSHTSATEPEREGESMKAFSWAEMKAMHPMACETFVKELTSDAEEGKADSDDGTYWWDDDVDYGGNPPGLQKVLEDDVRAIVKPDGGMVFEINPSGQVCNPGPSYYSVSSDGTGSRVAWDDEGGLEMLFDDA